MNIEQPINPPEYPGWSGNEKAKAVDELVDSLLGGMAWDENLEGDKSDMFAEWESIMLRTDLASDEVWALMRDAQHDYMRLWATEQVEAYPNKYCVQEDGLDLED